MKKLLLYSFIFINSYHFIFSNDPVIVEDVASENESSDDDEEEEEEETTFRHCPCKFKNIKNMKRFFYKLPKETVFIKDDQNLNATLIFQPPITLGEISAFFNEHGLNGLIDGEVILTD